MSKQVFYSNGKLLLTGEYLVIDGAQALAIPTSKGQSLTIKELEIENSKLVWESLTLENKPWLKVEFSLDNLYIQSTNDEKAALWLQNVLKTAQSLSDSFLNNTHSIKVTTKLDFPRDWGLGSSSTLINNVAQWAQVDPFELHFKVSNGSGYDIACAKEDTPIVYSSNNKVQKIDNIVLEKPFFNQVFFVHLNKKQNSFEAVTSYNELKKEIDLQSCVQSLNKITNQFIQANTLLEWENAMDNHEYLISNILQQETVKEKLFPLFPNSIKSLGAWGGDFIMATGTIEDSDYFTERGYKTVTFFDEMLLRTSH